MQYALNHLLLQSLSLWLIKLDSLVGMGGTWRSPLSCRNRDCDRRKGEMSHSVVFCAESWAHKSLASAEIGNSGRTKMNCLWAPMSCLNACCNKITISTAPKPQEEHPTNCWSGRPQCKIFRNLPLHATNTAKQVSQLFAAYHGVKWKWTRCNIHLAPTFLIIWWHGNLKAKNGLVQLGRSCVVHHFHSFLIQRKVSSYVFSLFQLLRPSFSTEE